MKSNQMVKGKIKLNKAIYIVLVSVVVIAIFSFTVGRELYEGRISA
jgi:hypothetical protein